MSYLGLKKKQELEEGRLYSFNLFLLRRPIGLFIFVSSLIIFSIVLIEEYNTDLDGHIHLLKLHLENGEFPFPPLYYASLYAIKLIFRINYEIGTVLLLSIAVLWKFNICLKYLQTQLSPFSRDQWMMILLVLGLMFFFPIFLPGLDGPKLYLGKFTPTIWHNSTIIFVFPFSLLLFSRSISYIESPNERDLKLMLLLSFLILISKPSFLFCFTPVFPFIFISKNQVDSNFFKVVAFCAFIVFGLSVSWWWIYAHGQIDSLLYAGEKTIVFFAPFQVWLNWTSTPVSDLLSSFLFLILFICFYGKTLVYDWHFQYASMLLLVGLFVFFIFAESGERFAHGNFYWQIPIGVFILHLILIKNWIQQIEIKASLVETIKGFSKVNLVLLGAFSFHVLSGGVYLSKLLYFGSFS